MRQSVHARRRPPTCTGFVTPGTLVVAAVAAFVFMSGCRSTPTHDASAGGEPLGATAVAASPGSLTAIQPFDEQFYVAPTDD